MGQYIPNDRPYTQIQLVRQSIRHLEKVGRDVNSENIGRETGLPRGTVTSLICRLIERKEIQRIGESPNEYGTGRCYYLYRSTNLKEG